LTLTTNEIEIKIDFYFNSFQLADARNTALRPSFSEFSLMYPSSDPTDWKILYRAAITETDRSILPQRISEAEAAVIARGREIFYGDAMPEEGEALEDALYALRAFRTAWPHAEAA
jgi:hypothetical protein